MQIEVTRVYVNEVPEHKDVLRRKKIYLELIEDIEESLNNKKYTTLKLTTGEEFTINESYDKFEKRLDDFMNGSKPGFKQS